MANFRMARLYRPELEDRRIPVDKRSAVPAGTANVGPPRRRRCRFREWAAWFTRRAPKEHLRDGGERSASERGIRTDSTEALESVRHMSGRWEGARRRSIRPGIVRKPGSRSA